MDLDLRAERSPTNLGRRVEACLHTFVVLVRFGGFDLHVKDDVHGLYHQRWNIDHRQEGHRQHDLLDLRLSTGVGAAAQRRSCGGQWRFAYQITAGGRALTATTTPLSG